MVQLEFDFPTPLDQLNTELAEIMDSIAALCIRRDTVKSKIRQMHNIDMVNSVLGARIVGTTIYFPHQTK
jgi:uridylate kinase